MVAASSSANLTTGSVAFPSSSSQVQVQPVVHKRPPHLPFRRISLPAGPHPNLSLLYRDNISQGGVNKRQSVASVASFDSTPEELSTPFVPPSPLSSSPSRPTPMRSAMSGRKSKRPGSSEGKRARSRQSSGKPQGEMEEQQREKFELKRRKIVFEFYETERAYVQGLDLVYEHFLSPLLSSLAPSNPTPLLDRSLLTSVFSNFIDIWNLHRTFYDELTALLFPHTTISTTDSAENMSAAPLSPLLLSHFPYLSLYTPFVTSFPTTIASLTSFTAPSSAFHSNPQYNAAFAAWLADKEKDPRCGRLKLRDWLLTIVQRCPRYLLLLKDLIEVTLPDEVERSGLEKAHGLVSKITTSLNTSLHTHAQTLSLLALQRSTPNLPFQLISPGRTLLKRGTLVQVDPEGNKNERRRGDEGEEREFLLFSDCLIWLVREDSGAEIRRERVYSRPPPVSAGIVEKSAGLPATPSRVPATHESGLAPPGAGAARPPMIRSRSKSEAELTVLHAQTAVSVTSGLASGPSSATPPTPGISTPTSTPVSTPSSPARQPPKSKSLMPPPPPSRKSYQQPPLSQLRRQSSHGNDSSERYTYKGRAELVDVEVIFAPLSPSMPTFDPTSPLAWHIQDEHRFEVLSPTGSFALYASSQEDRVEWCDAIRSAKSQLLDDLALRTGGANGEGGSTLTNSESTKHLRKVLLALPYEPGDERLGESVRLGKGSGDRDKEKEKKEKKHHKSKKSTDSSSSKFSSSSNPKDKAQPPKGRRAHVPHFIPAIWIPDSRAPACMRCSRTFSALPLVGRRRHHCRLCGRVVCASCSGRTFFITEPNSTTEPTKPARACNACYETVFPLLDPEQTSQPVSPTQAQLPHSPTESSSNQSTLGSLANFPSWMSMPSLPLTNHVQTPSALMALDFVEPGVSNHPGSRPSRRVLKQMRDYSQSELNLEDASGTEIDLDLDDPWDHNSQLKERRDRLRTRPSQVRPRSYVQILEDFESQPQYSSMQYAQSSLDVSSPLEEEENSDDDDRSLATSTSSKRRTVDLTDLAASDPRHMGQMRRAEDTARRNKRFSLPAVALQTTSVTTRTQQSGVIGVETRKMGAGGKSKRFSLVLNGRNQSHIGNNSMIEGSASDIPGAQDGAGSNDLGKGVAAGKLSALLGKNARVQ